jgi:hypothetical protein
MKQHFTTTSPICLLTRTDNDMSSIFHSFFLLNVLEDGKSFDVSWRIPCKRARIDDVESGLGIFVNDIIALRSSHKESEDIFGSFVITTSDGSRFFAFWRGSSANIFIGVSNYLYELTSII